MSEEDFRVHFPEKRGLFSFRTLKRVLQVLFALGMIGLFVFIGIRSITRKGSAEMQAYLWTEEALAASQGEDFTVYSIPAINEASTKATFMLSDIYYTEPIGQFQFLLSYNLGALKRLAEEYELDEVPEDGEGMFAFVLEDGNGTVYSEYEYVTDRMLVNGFYRLAFSGIPMTNRVTVGTYPLETGENPQTEAITALVPMEELRLCVYYKGAVDFEGKKLDELTIYEYNFFKEEKKITPPDALRDDIRKAVTTETVTTDAAGGKI